MTKAQCLACCCSQFIFQYYIISQTLMGAALETPKYWQLGISCIADPKQQLYPLILELN